MQFTIYKLKKQKYFTYVFKNIMKEKYSKKQLNFWANFIKKDMHLVSIQIQY
jgi:hypothetical protein